MAEATVSSPAGSTPHPQESHSPPKDTVRIRNLLLLARIADGAQWPSETLAPVRQPVRVSVSIPYDLRPAAAGDDISKSINYGSLSKQILASVEDPSSSFESLEHFLEHIFFTCFGAFPEIQEMTADVVKPRALPYVEGVRISSSRARDGSRLTPDRLSIQRFSCNLIVGLNPCEREDKQLVHFDVDISASHEPGSGFDLRRLAKDIRQEVESSEFISLESLACLTARVTLRHAKRPDNIVTVRAAKAKALVFADAAEVEIVRMPQDYLAASGVGASAHASLSTSLDPPIVSLDFLAQAVASDLYSSLEPPVQEQHHLAAIALGSNLGDRFANIEAALRLLERPEDFSPPQEPGTPLRLTVVNTSFLYETAPMYVTDQFNFLNCACVIKTTIAPLTLLAILKEIERTVGRVPSIRNGPRAVDLDILFYDDVLIDTRPESLKGKGDLEGLEGHLVVPHPRMSEREFVLRPLYDMVPDYVHPVFHKSIHEMFSDVLGAFPFGSPAMIKVMPFPAYPRSADRESPVKSVPDVPRTHTHWMFPPARPDRQVSIPRRTHLMATLNVTPDSFSDGADHVALSAALAYATSSTRAGAHIVDVGGYSTRPGAAHVSPEDEIARVVPVIKGIRATGSGAGDVLVSVDTFRPHVARAAVLAGANCINDVHAFTGPDYPHSSSSFSSAASYFSGMRGTARELAVPVILMHSRGDAGANKDYSRYDSVVGGVIQELGEKVEAIVRGPGGVRRWLVMIDPGIGFSKSVDDNVKLLRNSASITTDTRMVDGRWNPLRGYPQLIGASRKSFLGSILSQQDESGTYEGRQTTPKERGWATAAAVTSAVQQGAAVVRVHDTLEMGDVVRVANSIWG